MKDEIKIPTDRQIWEGQIATYWFDNRILVSLSKIILFLSTALLFQNFGCKEDKHERPTPKNDIVEVEQVDTTFGFFWLNFQKAVISNDFQKLAKLTKFPLETRGPLDEDKIVKYNESEFSTVFQAFLKEDTDLDLTELDLIKKLEKFDSSNNDFSIYKDEARVGEMEFHRIDKQWKLTFLYLYYGTIDEIDKKLNKK